jgi:hypothetical protein
MSEEKKYKEVENNKITKIKYPIGGFAPGHYISKCITCEEQFIGDMYANQCESCAINAVNESNIQAISKIHKLEAALDTIKEILGKE